MLFLILVLDLGLGVRDVYAMAAQAAHQRSQARRSQQTAHAGPEDQATDPGESEAGQNIGAQERGFLTKLSESAKNDSVSGRIESIIESLDNATQLDEADYDFLIKLSERIKNQKISQVITQIAERHHP